MMNIQKKLIWIDCDIGIDDFFAVFFAIAQPSIEIIGISSLYGNIDVNQVTKNCLQTLKLLGKDNQIPVIQGQQKPLFKEHKISGFHGSNGIGDQILPETEQKAIIDDSFNEMYKIISAQNEQIYFVATAGLTNLALLIQLYPDVKNKITECVIMGGSLDFGNISPSAEFNIHSDPEAAKLVFQSGLKIFLNPIELSFQIHSTEKQLNQIKQYSENNPNNRIYSVLYHLFQFYHQSHLKYKQKYAHFDTNTCPLYDIVNIYYLVAPEHFQIEFLNVEIETQSEFCNGRSIIDIDQSSNRQKNAFVGLKVNQDAFWEMFFKALDSYQEKK